MSTHINASKRILRQYQQKTYTEQLPQLTWICNEIWVKLCSSTLLALQLRVFSCGQDCTTVWQEHKTFKWRFYFGFLNRVMGKCFDVSEKRTASIVRAKEFIEVETFNWMNSAALKMVTVEFFQNAGIFNHYTEQKPKVKSTSNQQPTWQPKN
jgi:hypothetical protein